MDTCDKILSKISVPFNASTCSSQRPSNTFSSSSAANLTPSINLLHDTVPQSKFCPSPAFDMIKGKNDDKAEENMQVSHGTKNISNAVILSPSFSSSPTVTLQPWSTPESTLANDERFNDMFSEENQVKSLQFKLPAATISDSAEEFNNFEEKYCVDPPRYLSAITREDAARNIKKHCTYNLIKFCPSISSQISNSLSSDITETPVLEPTVRHVNQCLEEDSIRNYICRKAENDKKIADKGGILDTNSPSRTIRKDRELSTERILVGHILENPLAKTFETENINNSKMQHNEKFEICRSTVKKKSYPDRYWGESLYFSSLRRNYCKYKASDPSINASGACDIQSRPCYYHENNMEWRAKWRENGVTRQKTFAARRFGYSTARKTCEWIKEYIDRYNRVPTDMEIHEKVQELLKISIPEEEQIPPPKNPLNTGRKRQSKKPRQIPIFHYYREKKEGKLMQKIKKLKAAKRCIKTLNVNPRVSQEFPSCLPEDFSLSFSNSYVEHQCKNSNISLKPQVFYRGNAKNISEQSGNCNMSACFESTCLNTTDTCSASTNNSNKVKQPKKEANSDKNGFLFQQNIVNKNAFCYNKIQAGRSFLTPTSSMFCELKKTLVEPQPLKSQLHSIPINYLRCNNCFMEPTLSHLIYYVNDQSNVTQECSSSSPRSNNSNSLKKNGFIEESYIYDDNEKMADAISTPVLFDKFIRDYTEHTPQPLSVNNNIFFNEESNKMDYFDLSDHEETLSNLIINDTTPEIDNLK